MEDWSRFRFHDLRHTSEAAYKTELHSTCSIGHSSIQITLDTYGHLIPGAEIALVDRLNGKTTLHQNEPETHQDQSESEAEPLQVAEKILAAPRDSNPDMLIQSQLVYLRTDTQIIWLWDFLEWFHRHTFTVR